MDILVRRLRSGSFAQQVQALSTLMAACKDRPETSRAAAAAGAIPVLVWLLHSSASPVQAATANVIHKIEASAAELCPAILAAGALPALVPLLHSNSETVQAFATDALAELCHQNGDARRAAAAAGSIPAVVQLLCSGNRTALKATLVLLCSFILEESGELTAAIAAAPRAVPSLVSLLDPARRDNNYIMAAAQAIAGIGGNSRQIALACIEAGALPQLTQLAQAVDKVLHGDAVVAALGSLACHCPTEVAAETGTIPALVHIAQSSIEPNTLMYAAQGLGWLAAGSPQRSQAITEAGGLAALLALQNQANPGVRAHAGGPLSELLTASELQLIARAAAAGTERVGPARRVCAAEGCVATSGLKRCARCGAVRYCSPECQRAHWPTHRDTCRPR